MKPSPKPDVLLPQVEEFVATHIAKLCAAMKKKEEANTKAEFLTYAWHLTGKRPKVRDSRHFANTMKVSLRMQLSERGFAVRDIIGIIDHMTFHIEWWPHRV